MTRAGISCSICIREPPISITSFRARLTRRQCREAGETILNIVYGYNIEPHGRDALIQQVGEAMEQFSAASVPGKWAVDMLPFLENLPDWVPGTGFKYTARLWKQTMADVAEVPYNFARDRIGGGRTSFVSKSIEQARREGSFGPEDEHAIKWSAASMYAGGADTSVSTMAAFFPAMSMFPDVQRKAQEEIDRVIGSGRLPTPSDREKLPYVNAVAEEAQRWHPIAPMGLPHASDEEDTVDGFRITKGALLVPAIWWFTRDPETYHDPEEFKLERFLPPYSEPLATNVTFGFGRRVCPGRVLADASLFLTFAQSLAAFDIQKVRDKSGSMVEPVHTFSSGIIAHPGSFEVQVLPRNKQVAGLVDAVVSENPWVESDAKHIRKAGA
jgi:cytochrome P450